MLRVKSVTVKGCGASEEGRTALLGVVGVPTQLTLPSCAALLMLWRAEAASPALGFGRRP